MANRKDCFKIKTEEKMPAKLIFLSNSRKIRVQCALELNVQYVRNLEKRSAQHHNCSIIEILAGTVDVAFL